MSTFDFTEIELWHMDLSRSSGKSIPGLLELCFLLLNQGLLIKETLVWISSYTFQLHNDAFCLLQFFSQLSVKLGTIML